jgi:anti-sigma factor RsiW
MRFGRRTVICQQWVELVTDYLDDALPRGLRKAIDRHLVGCVHCQEYLDQMRRSIAINGAAVELAPIPEDLLALLQLAFEEHHAAPDSGT